jgi:DNA-binding GntR family transcriptional regulator
LEIDVSLPDRSGYISRDRPVSLTDQVADDIRSLIDGGTLTSRLPSELELADQYGVSRVTIRRSIAQLTSDGLLTVLHGVGTYVSEKNGQHEPAR